LPPTAQVKEEKRMPFTLSHPAAVLPLARWLPLSALVVGSMTPDLPYFLLTQGEFHHFGHKPVGLLLFDLPAGLLVLAVWHALLKTPLAALVPQGSVHRERLTREALRPSPLRSVSGTVLCAAAVLIGALTHVAWDACTHGNGWVVGQVPLLAAPLLPRPLPVVRDLPVYNVLQHASTLIGALLLVTAYRRWARTATPHTEDSATLPSPSARQRRALLAALLILAPAAGLAYAVSQQNRTGWTESVKKRVADGVEAAMLTGMLALIGYSVIWQMNGSVGGRR
jgi:hypothetical protein